MIPFKDYKGYTAVIDFNQNDRVFHGKILGLSDLVSFEGTNVEELDSAFKEAVDDYLETCKEIGKNPEKTFKGSFNVRLSPELHRSLYFYAESKNMSLNQVISEAVGDFLLTCDEQNSQVNWEYSRHSDFKSAAVCIYSRSQVLSRLIQCEPSKSVLKRGLLKKNFADCSKWLHYKTIHK